MNGIITLDIGTTSLRATLHDEKGKALAVEQIQNPPAYYADGRVEQDAAAWDERVPAAIKAAADRGKSLGIKIAALSLTAQRSSVIPVDRGGNALRPAIMWQDLRTAPLVAALSANDAEVYARCGLRAGTVFSAVKMLWIKREEPEIYARTHRMLGIQDYVVLKLTGRFATDWSLASRSNLIDLDAKTWSEELMSLFEVRPDHLCELVPPGSILGGILPEAAERLGLPSGLPVVGAGGDQQCAALGLGLFSSRRAVTNTGTGSYLLGHSDARPRDPAMRVQCNLAALPGAYIVEAALPTSGSVYRWLAELWKDGEGGNALKQLDAEAEAAGPGAGGVVMLPLFNGSGSPDWNAAARGTFHGLSLATTRGDLARAALEGIAFELAGGLDVVEELCGAAEEIGAAGGLSRLSLFNHILADVFGKPLLRHPGGEATALGAWMSGAVAAGLAPDFAAAYRAATEDEPADRFEPDNGKQKIYTDARRKAASVRALLSSI